MVLELREEVDTMTNLKFGLKQRMVYEKFEVQIIQMKPREFQIIILEMVGYSNDDSFYHTVDTKTTLGQAQEVQSDTFMYMMNNDFRNVKKAYYR